MSRFERDFDAAGDAPSGAVPDEQRVAIACYLSAGEGWDKAVKSLRGTFASDAAAALRSAGSAEHKREINHRTSEYLQWPGLKSAATDND